MKRQAALMATALLAACAGPRPAVPVAASIQPPASWRHQAATEGIIDADWWRSFGDPQLTRLVEAALAANSDIAIAATRVAEARAQYRLASAQLQPEFAIQAGGGWQRQPGVFGAGLTQLAGRGELAISYDVDFFGRLSSAEAAARAALLSTEAGHANVRIAIAAAVSVGYIELCSLDAQRAVLRQTMAARAASLAFQRRRVEAGYSTRLELSQSEAEYQATAAQIPRIELAMSKLEDSLSVLLGQNPRAIDHGQGLTAIAHPSVPLGLPSTLLRQRPDIIAAENDLVSAEHSLDSSRAAFMPRVRLSATGGFVGAEALPSNPLDVFAIGASILAPIFDTGRLRAQSDAVGARRDRAAFAYRKTALIAFGEVEDALAAVRRTSELEEALAAQRQALANALALATSRYRAGYSPYLERLDAQRGLLSADLQLVQVRADRLTATVGLFRALGGGWRTDEQGR